MSANAPQPALNAKMAPPDYADLDELFLQYYEHRFDYQIQLQAELREDLALESAPPARRPEAPRPFAGPAWFGTGA
jgi:hypothetical protein